MRFLKTCCLVLCGLASVVFADADSPTAAGASVYQASNLLNPNISAIGWFQAEAGHRDVNTNEAAQNAFNMKETELAFQAVVDPWARGDFFLSVEPDKVSLEEGYITWFRLPGGLGLKAGKFKANMGRFNRIHTPETPFADRPLAEQAYFGDEGLNGAGGSLSWAIPNPWLYMNLNGEIYTAPAMGDNPSFARAEPKDVTYTGRWSGFYDLTEAMNVAFGASMAYGPGGTEFRAVSNSTNTLHAEIYSADLTFRWKNPRRAIYRSVLWSTEIFFGHHDMSLANAVDSHGLFSYIDWQFAQRWHTGVRYDYTQSPTNGSQHDEGGLVFLTLFPTEFSQISLQGRQVKRADGAVEDLGFLKITFNIGPHGAHPF